MALAGNPTSSRSPAPVRSLDAITEPAVRAYLDRALARPETLGLLLVGSRALGWADPRGDYDLFLLVPAAHLRTLPPEEAQVFLFAEGEIPKRMIGDFSYVSEETLETHRKSPLDIDHWPYLDAVVLADRTGRLPDWCARISALPEAERRERAIQKYLQMAIALSYATADDVRGYGADRQMNLFRSVLAGLHLWFALRGRWAPPFKWWTREVERLEMRPDTRGILEAASLNPAIETVIPLRDHLREEMRHAGITEVNDPVRAFIERLTLDARDAQYRHTYL
jgi:hypothetical protein